MFILAVYFSQWQLGFLNENPTLLVSWLVAGTKEISIFGSYHSQLEAKTFPMMYGMICCCKVFYEEILSQTMASIRILGDFTIQIFKGRFLKMGLPHTWCKESPLQLHSHAPNFPVSFRTIFCRYLQRGLLIYHS